MRVTQYSKIANKYEENQYRHNIQIDDVLYNLLQKADHQLVCLDLASGTGLYLGQQLQGLKDYDMTWHALDASLDMLAVAQEKQLLNENVSFIHGFAEDMPYEDETFDFINNNFAFHHFVYKKEALDEIYRVLKQDGIFKMYNTANHMMRDWWLYQYFPTAFEEDMHRYWEHHKIFKELTLRGFEVNIDIHYEMLESQLSEFFTYASNRDISALTLISDEDYDQGLNKMQRELEEDPNKTIISDFALMNCVARKK